MLETDGFTTLMGAHCGEPGTIVAIGTGSVGQALLPGGEQREVGGWGFPAGDEASGGWIGLRAINHIEQVIDGRKPASAFAQAVIDACGGGRDAIQVWLGQASQTSYAQLAPIVIAHAGSDEPRAACWPTPAAKWPASRTRSTLPARCRWPCAAALARRCAPTCRPTCWRAASPRAAMPPAARCA